MSDFHRQGSRGSHSDFQSVDPWKGRPQKKQRRSVEEHNASLAARVGLPTTPSSGGASSTDIVSTEPSPSGFGSGDESGVLELDLDAPYVRGSDERQPGDALDRLVASLEMELPPPMSPQEVCDTSADRSAFFSLCAAEADEYGMHWLDGERTFFPRDAGWE